MDLNCTFASSFTSFPSFFFISSLMTFGLRSSGLFDVYIFTILICRKTLFSLGIDCMDTGRIL